MVSLFRRQGREGSRASGISGCGGPLSVATFVRPLRYRALRKTQRLISLSTALVNANRPRLHALLVHSHTKHTHTHTHTQTDRQTDSEREITTTTQILYDFCQANVC